MTAEKNEDWGPPAMVGPIDHRRQLVKRAQKAILALGAIATAIGAIVALLPSPDPVDRASFTSITVIAPVPITEFRARNVGSASQGVAVPMAGDSVRNALASQSSTSSSPATEDAIDDDAERAVSPTASPPPGSISSEAPSVDDGQSTAPASDQPIDDAEVDLSQLRRVAPILSPEVRWNLMKKVARMLDYDPGPNLARSMDCIAEPVTANGQLRPYDEVVTNALETLRHTRTIEVASSGSGGPTREHVGAMVSADIELAGLRNRPVLLSWSIWQVGGDTRLFSEWLNSVPVYRLTPRTELDTTTVALWIPIPMQPGPYIVRLKLSVNGSPLASGETEPFG